MKALWSLVLAVILSATATLQAELPTKKVLTLGMAKKLVAAAEAEDEFRSGHRRLNIARPSIAIPGTGESRQRADRAGHSFRRHPIRMATDRGHGAQGGRSV